jgi:hypothetical protein
MKKTARLTITGLLGLGMLLGVAAPASAAEQPKSISAQLDELTVIYPGDGHHKAIDFGDEISGGGEFSLPEPGSIVAGMEG